MALLHVEFFSDVLGMYTEMGVILPQKSQNHNKRKDGKYPTLYLLHGIKDNHTVWLSKTSIERYANEKGIAIVMPNAHLSWYTDMYCGQRYWTFISKELLEICHEFFPNMSNLKEDTFAAGVSMGGYGALKLGLRATETFSAVASLSGGLNIVDICDAEKAEAPSVWDNVFGPSDCIRGSDNDLFTLADKLNKSNKPKPLIYMWCGKQDALYNQNISMKDYLLKLGYPLTYEETNGEHGWTYWEKRIQKVIEWLPIKKNEAT